MATVISSYLLDEEQPIRAAAAVLSEYLLDVDLSPVENIFTLPATIEKILFVTRTFTLSYGIEKLTPTNRSFTLRYSVDQYMTSQLDFSLGYNILLADTIKTFLLRYRNNVDVPASNYSFTNRYNIQLVTASNFIFKLPYQNQPTNQGNYTFSQRYLVNKYRTSLQVFRLGYKVEQYVQKLNEFVLPYALRRSDIQPTYGFPGNNFTVTLGSLPLGNYNLLLDNGGKYNKYLFNVNWGKNYSDDNVDIAFNEVFSFAAGSGSTNENIYLSEDIIHTNGQYGWENATSEKPLGGGTLLLNAAHTVIGPKPYSASRTTVPLVISGSTRTVILDLTENQGYRPIIYIIRDTGNKLIASAVAPSASAYARLVTTLPVGNYTIVLSTVMIPTVPGTQSTFHLTAYGHTGTLLEANKDYDPGFAQDFPITSDINLAITNPTVIFKNIEKKAQISFSIYDRDFNEQVYTLPSLIHPDYSGEIVLQSSNLLRIFLAKDLTCCFEKSPLTDDSVCEIPLENLYLNGLNGFLYNKDFTFKYNQILDDAVIPPTINRLYTKGKQVLGDMGHPIEFDGVAIDWTTVGTFTDWTKILTPAGAGSSSNGGLVGLRSDGTIWTCGDIGSLNGFGSGHAGMLGYADGNANGGKRQYGMKQVGVKTDWINFWCDNLSTVFALDSQGDLYFWGSMFLNPPEVPDMESITPQLLASNMTGLIDVTYDTFGYVIFTLLNAGIYTHKVLGNFRQLVCWFESDVEIAGTANDYPTVTNLEPYTPFTIAKITAFESIAPVALDPDGNLYSDGDRTGRDFTLRGTNFAYISQSTDFQAMLDKDGAFWMYEPFSDTSPPGFGIGKFDDGNVYLKVRIGPYFDASDSFLLRNDNTLWFTNYQKYDYTSDDTFTFESDFLTPLPGPTDTTITDIEYIWPGVNTSGINSRFAVLGDGPQIDPL